MKNKEAKLRSMRRLWVVLIVTFEYAYDAFGQGEGIVEREVHFYSEGVLCYGKLWLPEGYSDSHKVAAVILAPGAKRTSESLNKYAKDLAAHGLVAMTFDYRGWGKSGGFLYFGEPVRWDDRLRFSQSTTKMRIRRQRLEPQLQVIDIRNAITYVQGESGVDRTRIGVLGVDLSGGHAVVVAGSDARVKAIVAQSPMLEGKDAPKKAFTPTAEQQSAMVKLARTGSAPTTNQGAVARNAEESKLAFAEYHPFWYLEQIPATTSVRFIVAEKETDASVDANVSAASKVLKGPMDVVKISTAPTVDDKSSASVRSSTDWFVAHL